MDSNNYATDTMQYDPAGNLTYDGVESYAYDAWNRLISVAHAYRDDGGTLHTGQVFETMSYDGQGRRIVKAITGTGQFDCTYHYYYDQDKTIETRNGSDQTLKQQVWGIQYVDELVEIALNDNPSTGNYCGEPYWVLQDANWNVLGIVNGDGDLKERYEYTPYGQRTVFFSPGSNDPGCYAPTLMSRREFLGPITRPYGLCEFGHQGLMHDELTGLVYNRARMLQPVLERFMQRDPLGYVDGMSLYQTAGNNPINDVDPNGLRRRGIGLFDDRGWELFSHWMGGSGTPIVTHGGSWGSYMEANTLLPPQIASEIRSDALGRTKSGPVNITFHATIENGYSTGYEMLHGTNATVGDFEIAGQANMAKGECKIKYHLTYTWHDVIDPNPTYFLDTVFSWTLGLFSNPKDYEVHLSWDSNPTITLGGNPPIKEEGYPFDQK